MYLIDNPVLQRELLVNLRMRQGVRLVVAVSGVVGDRRVLRLAPGNATRRKCRASARDWSTCSSSASTYLASLMAPSFAAATITGEKERKTYEMLLASPLRPSAITLGQATLVLSSSWPF